MKLSQVKASLGVPFGAGISEIDVGWLPPARCHCFKTALNAGVHFTSTEASSLIGRFIVLVFAKASPQASHKHDA